MTAQLRRDVGVAEAVEAANLDEPFADVEDARARPNLPAVAVRALLCRFVVRSLGHWRILAAELDNLPTE